MHARIDHHIAAYPYIVTDGYSDTIFPAGISGFRVQGMAGSVDGDIGGKHNIFSDGHFSDI